MLFRSHRLPLFAPTLCSEQMEAMGLQGGQVGRAVDQSIDGGPGIHGFGRAGRRGRCGTVAPSPVSGLQHSQTIRRKPPAVEGRRYKPIGWTSACNQK